MSLLAFASLLADAATEGRNVLIGMLVVGLIFLSVIALGELGRSASHRRKDRRRASELERGL